MKIVHINKEKKEIVQLKITIKDSKPPIWRRFLVKTDITFEDLHHIIQNVMGWENDHLYKFNVGKTSITIDDFADDYFDKKTMDSLKVNLNQYLKTPKQKITYTYDFGDSWKHEIIVEKFLEIDQELKYPICIDGKNNCPPEDCGGIWGFYDMLDIINDKNHPENEEMLEWLGDDYEPTYFSLDEINERLK